MADKLCTTRHYPSPHLLPCSTTFNPSTAEMLHLILAKMKTRKAAYEWLAKKIEIHVDDCHVGQFDTEQCQQVIQHCAPYINLAMSKMKKVEFLQHFEYRIDML